MESLLQSYRTRLDLTPTDYVRTFHNTVNWKNRLIGILGQKGVGKSTMILQHIKLFDKIEESLYVQADDFYFAENRIYDLALLFFQQGGKRIYIDEIHKYPGWATEIKMIYDQLPLLSVVYSGSSILDLKKGTKADLSRRTIEYSMPILSFREYLNISQGWNLKVSTLSEILAGKVDFPYGEHRPIKYYQEYLRCGCYPYFTEEDYLIKLKQAINATIEDDIPKYAEMTVAAGAKLKKLMLMIARSVPYKPNYTTLARDLDISRNILPDYIEYLEKSRLFIDNEKGIDLDDCEKVTRSLNDFLDELIPIKYYLEVSSPGLERKFKSDKEFVIFKGRRISIKLKTPLEGETERIFKGEIIDWDDNEGLTFLRFEDGEQLQIPKSNIQSAKLYID